MQARDNVSVGARLARNADLIRTVGRRRHSYPREPGEHPLLTHGHVHSNKGVQTSSWDCFVRDLAWEKIPC